MNILSLIKEIFKPAVELVDDLHTSEEEKLIQKAQTLDTYVDALEAGLKYEQDQLETRARIVEAEAKSEHWLTATWRPVTMLTFVAAVVGYWFGLTPDDLPESAVDNMFLLVQIGLGGYVVGRSAEKVAPSIVRALKQRDET